MTAVRIIPAQPEWAPCLSAIAIAAKAHWKYPVTWLVRWESALTISPRYIRSTQTRVALYRGRIAGFYSVHPQSHSASSLDHLWVLPGVMGHGIGRRLFSHAEQCSIEGGFFEMRIESDPHAEGFYRHMGAQRIGQLDSQIEGAPRCLPLLRKVHSVLA